LPAEPGPYHQGGKLKVGTDNKNLYAVIGDLTAPNGMLQNFRDGKNLITHLVYCKYGWIIIILRIPIVKVIFFILLAEIIQA
jgi:hypothetical protein